MNKLTMKKCLIVLLLVCLPQVMAHAKKNTIKLKAPSVKSITKSVTGVGGAVINSATQAGSAIKKESDDLGVTKAVETGVGAVKKEGEAAVNTMGNAGSDFSDDSSKFSNNAQDFTNDTGSSISTTVIESPASTSSPSSDFTSNASLNLTPQSNSGSSLSLTPPASDYSVAFLSNLFGIVDGVLHGTGSQIMGAIFSVFNSAVLALGGIVIMYTLIVGTMNTAHEGEMLGHKWSSIWIPVRSTAGLALLIPKASGYCLMQIFVMWVVVQGVGAADKVWDAALNYLNRGGVIIQTSMNPNISASADSGEIARGAANILAGEVCMLGLQKTLEATRARYLADADQEPKDSQFCSTTGLQSTVSSLKIFCNTPVPDFLATVDTVAFQSAAVAAATPPALPPSSFTMPMPNFDSGSPYYFLHGICGSITWNALPSIVNETNTNSASKQAEYDLISQTRATAIQQLYMDYQMVAQAMVNNDPQIVVPTTSTNNAACPQATEVFGVPYSESNNAACTSETADCAIWQGGTDCDGDTTDIPLFNGTEFQNGIADYNGVMMPTLNLMNNVMTDQKKLKAREFIAKSEREGWLSAGSYFFDLVNLNGSATAATNLTDTNTGLGRSTSASPACSETEQPELCVWLTGSSTDPTKIEAAKATLTNINALIGTAPHSYALGGAALNGSVASTVFGFVTNSLIIQLPGQPAATAPKFDISLFPKMAPANYDFGLPKPACNGFRFMGHDFCIGGYIMSGLYAFFKAYIHLFRDILAVWINNMILVIITVPLAAMESTFVTGVEYLTQHPGDNPIVALAQMGVFYINAPANLYVSMITMVIGANLTIIPPIGQIIAMIMVLLFGMASPLIISWMGVMLAVGFTTAFYVPFLPYMVFTFGVIGWLTAVIEAMAAAPIVALAITHPEGEGILGNKGEAALMILMNVFLRPAMMIIGYIAAIALCYVSVWIINTGFGHVLEFIKGPMYNGWAGLYVLFFSILIYTTMYVTVAQKSFNLIYILPDKILRWIGGHEEGVGHEAAGWAGETQKQVEKGGTDTEKGQAGTLEKTVGEAKKGLDAAGAVGSSSVSSTPGGDGGGENGGGGGGAGGGSGGGSGGGTPPTPPAGGGSPPPVPPAAAGAAVA